MALCVQTRPLRSLSHASYDFALSYLQTPDEGAAIAAMKLAFENGVNFFGELPASSLCAALLLECGHESRTKSNG